MSDELLKQAIGLIKAGDKKQGRSILVQIIKQQPKNELAWLCLSVCVSTDGEKRDCIKKVLEINPANQNAQQALNRLSSRIDEPTIDDMGPIEKPVLEKPPVKASSIVTKKPGQIKKKQKITPILVVLLGGLVLVIISVLVIIAIALVPNLVPMVVLDAPRSTLSPIPTQTAAPTQTSAPTQITIPTLTSQQLYSNQMKPVLNSLNSWMTTLGKWNSLMDKRTAFDNPISNEKNITYQGVLTLYLFYVYGGVSSMAKSMDSYGSVKSEILPLADSLKTDGFQVLTEFDNVTPPSEIIRSHKQLVSCLEYQVKYFNEISKAITEFTYNKPEDPSGSCEFMKESMANISNYVFR